MSDKLIDEAVKFLSSKSTSNPFQTAKENLAELKQSTVSNYLKKAIPDHDMLNVARRNSTGDEQKELARKEAQRKQGISKAVTRLDKNEEVEEVAEGGPFSYSKPPRKGSVADLADKKRREQERGKQPIEPRDQRVGVAKVTKGVAEGTGPFSSSDYMKGPTRSLADVHKTSSYTVATNAIGGHKEHRIKVDATSKNHAMNLAGDHFRNEKKLQPRVHYDGLRVVEQTHIDELDEMDKSQPSSSRGAEGLPLGKKADPVKTDKVKSDALKVLQKQYKKVNESSYNDDDHYAIHPDTGKVMDSWSKRDSRVNAAMSQQHKEKGHIIKTGRELNYAEYAKSKNESIEEDFTKMKDHELKQWINTRQQNALAHNLTSKRQEQLKQAQDELKKRKS